MQADWTTFRNGGNNGAAGIKRLPLRWSPTQGIAWKTELPGYGQSSPVVWKGRVFVTSVQGPQRERCLVHACDLKSGKLLWSRSFASSLPHEMNNYISRAAPTPAVDAKGVYAFFESGELAGLDHNGKTLWSRSLVKEYGKLLNEFGIGQSLAQNADTIFVLVDDPTVAYVLAVDKRTGKNRWETVRTPRQSWASPVVTKYKGRELLVISADGSVDGLDTKDGTLLWSVDRLSGNTKPSVSVEGDLVFVGASAGPTKPGRRTPAESNCCLQLSESQGKLTAKVLWEGTKATCDFASPLVYRGLVYYVTAAGVVFCVDSKTGKQLYSERIESPCWATPVAVGEHLYFLGKNGITTLIKAGPVFEKVASNALWDPQNPPKANEVKPGAPGASGSDNLDPALYGYAALEGQLVVRLGSQLFCIR